MNRYHEALMPAPSLTPGYCVVCGAPHPTRHHVVPRSQGGHDGPLVHLCGHGTAGCHGKAEDKMLHFRYTDRWEWLETYVPMKYEGTLEMEGWRPCVSCEWGAC